MESPAEPDARSGKIGQLLGNGKPVSRQTATEALGIALGQRLIGLPDAAGRAFARLRQGALAARAASHMGT